MSNKVLTTIFLAFLSVTSSLANAQQQNRSQYPNQILASTANQNYNNFPTCQLLRNNSGKAYLIPLGVRRGEWKNAPSNLDAANVGTLMVLGEYTVLETIARTGSIGVAQGMSTIGSAVFLGGSIYSMVKADKKVLVGFIDGRTSQAIPETNKPKFEVSWGEIVGWNPDDYEAVIIRLFPTKDNYRAVGVLKTKSQNRVISKKMTVSIIEERLPLQVRNLGSGRVEIEPQSPLGPGEYAIAIRPHWQAKEGSLNEWKSNDFSRLPDYVWSFTISQ